MLLFFFLLNKIHLFIFRVISIATNPFRLYMYIDIYIRSKDNKIHKHNTRYNIFFFIQDQQKFKQNVLLPG